MRSPEYALDLIGLKKLCFFLLWHLIPPSFVRDGVIEARTQKGLEGNKSETIVVRLLRSATLVWLQGEIKNT